MNKQERVKLVAPCGIDCGICELYLSRNNPQIKDYLLSRGMPEEKIPCDGCRDIDGKCPIMPDECATWECVTQKGVAYCHECGEFPCSHLAPAASRAAVLPHNMKVYNLCVIRRDGAEAFTRQSAEIKQAYFKGKMEIGKGPVRES